MLVLSRKKGETIKISDEITIVVTEIHGDRVALGIDAPRSMGIRRGELRPLPERARSVTIPPPIPPKGDVRMVSREIERGGPASCNS